MNLVKTFVAARKFGVTVNTIGVWILRGKLTRHQEGEKWARILVDLDEVAKLVKSLKKKAPPRRSVVKRSDTVCNYCESAPIDRNLPISEITKERRWLCRPCWKLDESTKEGKGVKG